MSGDPTVGTGGSDGPSTSGTGGLTASGGSGSQIGSTAGGSGRAGAVGGGDTGSGGDGRAEGGAPGTAGSGAADAGATEPADNAKYNFEASTQGWGMSAGSLATFTSVATSTTHAFAGRTALAAALVAPAIAANFILEVSPPTPAIPAGASVAFHVYVPRSAVLTAVQPYVLETTTFRFTGSYVSAANLVRDGWTTVTVKLPVDATAILRMGVRFESSGAWTDTVYVDSVDW